MTFLINILKVLKKFKVNEYPVTEEDTNMLILVVRVCACICVCVRARVIRL